MTVATVSNVLSGSVRVRAVTRAKVLAAIAEVNYHPNLITRALAKRKVGTIGVDDDILRVEVNGFHAGRSATQYLPDRGHHSIAAVLNCRGNRPIWRRFRQRCKARD